MCSQLTAVARTSALLIDVCLRMGQTQLRESRRQLRRAASSEA